MREGLYRRKRKMRKCTDVLFLQMYTAFSLGDFIALTMWFICKYSKILEIGGSAS